MSDRTVLVVGAIAGAMVGAILSHFILTPRGRQALEEIDHRFDEVIREVGRMSQSAGRIARSANEGLHWFQHLRLAASSSLRS